MRRFLTLVCLLCLAIPAGISISGCTRNPGGELLQWPGLRVEDHGRGLDHAAAADHGHFAGLRADAADGSAHGQDLQGRLRPPCRLITYGTTNNQLVDISPTGNICAGTWNRNTGGGIADYTICNLPNPLPSTGGLPYGIAYITASANSVTSNPVEVYVHAQVTSSVGHSARCGPRSSAFRRGRLATLDAQACYRQQQPAAV